MLRPGGHWSLAGDLDIASAWAVSHLDDGHAVLIVDEKSSADAVGAARQYSGTVGGIALCQAAVTLTYATGRGHAPISRDVYLPEARAADEEHRELVGVPEEVMFASEPQLAAGLLKPSQQAAMEAARRAAPERQPPPVVVEQLTERERDVLRLVGELLSTDEIADKMFISVNTVKSHLKNSFRKLGATDRRDAVRRARETRLL